MPNDDRNHGRLDFKSGGSSGGTTLKGSPDHVSWATDLRGRVEAEFDRMRGSIEAGSNKFRSLDRSETTVLLALLDEYRASILSADQAGYFIAEWQNPVDRLQRLCNSDDRWRAIVDARAARRTRTEAVAPIRYLGFDDAAGTRIYKFGRLPSHEGMEVFVVSMAVELFQKHKISFQDGPAMCSAIMAASAEPCDHWVTDEDSLEFISRRPVKAERKPPRQKQALPAQ